MVTRNYGLVESTDTLKKWVDKIMQTDLPIGFDLEAGYYGPDRKKGSLQPHAGTFIVGFSFTVDPKWARYVPIRHDYGGNLPEDEVWDVIRPMLMSGRLVAHNAKYEKRMLRTEGIDIDPLDDTMLMSFVLQDQQHHGLKELVRNLFNHEMAELSSLFPGMKSKDEDFIRFNVLDITPEVVSYACEDAAWCLALRERFLPMLESQPMLMKLYRSVEMPTMNILCDMEDHGVAIDWDGMGHAYAQAEPFFVRFETEVKKGLSDLSGTDCSTMNLASTVQLRTLLFETMGLTPTKITKSDNPSTDAVALERLSKKEPFIKELLELREVKNLSNRFAKWLDIDLTESRTRGLDGRTHASYNQVKVQGGRFSANDPPIQQCPKDWFWCVGEARKTYDEFEPPPEEKDVPNAKRQAAIDVGKPELVWTGNFRDYLVAGEGTYLLGFDYSQIELRVLAGLAQEKKLLDAFERGDDVHKLTAALMLSKREDDVTPSERQTGKTMNFGLIYGMSESSLGQRLAISDEEAKRLYTAYFEGFTNIDVWMASTKEQGTFNGYVTSWLGRKSVIWELTDPSRRVRSKADRKFINVPVQGGAADYVKLAMVRVACKLKEKGWWMTKVSLVMNQHDALTFEVDNSIHPGELIEFLRPLVEFPVQGFPPMLSEWEIGQRWGQCVPCSEKDTFVFEGVWHVASDNVVAMPIPKTEEPEVTENSEDVAPTPEGRTVIVEVEDMPSTDVWERFVEFVREYPGPNTVQMRTPEGSFDMDIGTSMTIEDQSKIAMTLGGAKVFYPPEEVDASVIRLTL